MTNGDTSRTRHAAGIVLVAAMTIGAAAAKPAQPTTFPAVPDQEHLHNAHVVIPGKVISGAQPEGEESFAALQQLGVKTIITVDGAKPDVETARKYGMRYVHLPIGYDGVPDDTGKAIAKAIKELPGPVYVHCHHGKHRSAAAVAVACVNNGMLPKSKAEDVLRTFGTGAEYGGLWASARDAGLLEESELRDLKVEFVEHAEIGEYAEAMVHVDQHWDNIKLIQKAGWRQPPGHSDLDPAHEALQTREMLHEGGRLDSTGDRPAEFKEQLERAEEAVEALRVILAKKPVDTAAADAKFKVASETCATCHKAYRN
jgi:protein tyrosine phosphatase (PTP) superfamily phosphohydrolase (DUF442 family)